MICESAQKRRREFGKDALFTEYAKYGMITLENEIDFIKIKILH